MQSSHMTYDESVLYDLKVYERSWKTAELLDILDHIVGFGNRYIIMS